MTDIVDALAGVEPGGRLDALRRGRPQTRDNVQASYDALFGADGGGVPLAGRLFVAAFVAGLSAPDSTVAEHYRDRAVEASPGRGRLLTECLDAAAQPGPWGTYREAGLVDESLAGEPWRATPEQRTALGGPLAAVLEYAHLLVLHPRDADAAAVRAVLDAGWTRAHLVTWAQLVSFVSFQVRLVVGLTALAAASGQGRQS